VILVAIFGNLYLENRSFLEIEAFHSDSPKWIEHQKFGTAAILSMHNAEVILSFLRNLRAVFKGIDLNLP